MKETEKITKGQFISRWAFFPINNTLNGVELMAKVGEFNKLADKFYYSIARLYPWWRKIRPCIKQYIYPWLSDEEKALLNHPIGKQLYNIWIANIEGKKYGYRAEVQEKIAFFKYMFMNLNIAHNPDFAEKSVDYQNLLFSLKLLRPNIDAHIYITFPFTIRPLKKFIRQYCEMAVITGDYEFLLKRFPPYHTMLYLNVAPGQRTALDLRGFDIPPIIYKLPFKYNLGIELDKVQTRSNNRFVNCHVVTDFRLEQMKKAEIKQMEGALKGALPNFSYVTNVDFKDGKVWYGNIPEEKKIKPRFECTEALIGAVSGLCLGILFGTFHNNFVLGIASGIASAFVSGFFALFVSKVTLLGVLSGLLMGILVGNIYNDFITGIISGLLFGTIVSFSYTYFIKQLQKEEAQKKEDQQREEIEMYGGRRATFLKLQSELDLLKANPVPGTDSGLIIRFQLHHPVTVLLEGINRKREVSLEEIEYVWKVLDLHENEVRKPEKDQKKLTDTIDDVFANPNIGGLKDETIEFLKEIHRLQKEDPTDEKAWQFLTDRFLEGKAKNLLNAICLRLLTDGFDLVFSLWPLLTGKEISIDQASGEVKIKEYRDEVDEDRKTGNDVKKIRKKKKNMTSETGKEEYDGKQRLLPMLETLKNELEDLLRNIFSKYIDISAATNRARSEPILAGLIVEACLNSKTTPELVEKKLKKHLYHHYEVHYNFLHEYIKSDDRRKQQFPPSVLENIHRLKLRKIQVSEGVIKLELDMDKIYEQIDNDIKGIMELIDIAKNRLYSPTGSLRLLCFIDPLSIDVQIGDFFYEGKGLYEEEQFIAEYQKIQYELAKVENIKRAEIEDFDLKRKAVKELNRMKLESMIGKENFAKKEAESLRRIKEVEIDNMFTEAKYEAMKKLKDGNIKEYGILSLIKAHHEGGAEAVENLLENSPNLVMAINPDLYTKQAMSMIKKKLVGIMAENPDKIDKVSLAMLLKEDFKDIVATDIYKEFNDIFVEMLNKTRLGIPYTPMRPTWNGDLRGEGRPGMRSRSQENDMETVSGEVSEITDQSISGYEEAEEGMIIKSEQREPPEEPSEESIDLEDQ